MRRTLIRLLGLCLVGAAVFWFVTEPRVLTAADLPDHKADPEHGRYMFYAAGCGACHAAPGAKGDDRLKLAGGLGLKTPFGTFYAPNISPDPADGIGGWSDLDFVNAVVRGVAPGGSHLYPVFPYLSYQRMTLEDVLDLKSFLDTLPAVAGRPPADDIPVYLKWRRLLGGWKFLFMDNRPFRPIPGASAEVNRGAYLVTGPGHCGECHTPRNILGAPEEDRAFAGAPDLEGKGDGVPNITPGPGGIGSWSAHDIATALKTGLLPEFETFGGSMIEVQENMAQLTDADRDAIAAYLKTLPPRPSAGKE